jgi:membrane peptidoglycan carboxypeptidase
MALGTNEVNLLDLTGAFASVRIGRKIEPWGIAAFGVEGSAMRSLGAPSAAGPELSHQPEMRHLLQAVVEQGTGRGASGGNDVRAGKTGTSQDHRDAWFVGFDNNLIVGVWLGNDDRAPMKGVTGGSLPVEIWKRFVEQSHPVISASARPEITRHSALIPSSIPQHEQAQCDLAACAAAYRSFRASDCTYQSYGGERKLCPKPLQTTDPISGNYELRRARSRFGANPLPASTADDDRVDSEARSSRLSRWNEGTSPRPRIQAEHGSWRPSFDGLGDRP